MREMWRDAHELLLTALKPHPSYSQLAKYLGMEQFNLHIGRPSLEVSDSGMYNTNNIQGALYPLQTHLNHSCVPNAKTVMSSRGRLAEINGMLSERDTNAVLVRENDIAEGDEITVAYVDTVWQPAVRRETLKRDYSFACRCKACLEYLYAEFDTPEKEQTK